jgi:hypothetical protein
MHIKSPPDGGFFLWWSIGDSGQALFHFAMLEASFCAWLNSTEPHPFGRWVLEQYYPFKKSAKKRIV